MWYGRINLTSSIICITYGKSVIIMATLWWISHLLWNYTTKSAPNWHNNHIIGLLIINNLHLDTNILILLCLEQNILYSDRCCRYRRSWPQSWILEKPSQWRVPTHAQFHLHAKNYWKMQRNYCYQSLHTSHKYGLLPPDYTVYSWLNCGFLPCSGSRCPIPRNIPRNSRGAST